MTDAIISKTLKWAEYENIFLFPLSNVSFLIYFEQFLQLLNHRAIRGRPFDSWGGGAMFFFVKKRLFSKFWKIYSLFSYMWEKIVCS